MFGVLLTGIGLMFLQGDVELWQMSWSWFWPTVLTLAGVLVLAPAWSGSRGDAGTATTRSRRDPPEPI